MTGPPGDFVKAVVSIRLPRERTFELFTQQIDRWWRRGPKFRASGMNRGLICIEPFVGGRIFESWNDGADESAFEIGRVLDWEPFDRLAFSWRGPNFAPRENTHVEVIFEAVGDATRVTVIHSGWAAIRPDHPARHGLDIPAFQRMLGMWWGDQLGHLRLVASARADTDPEKSQAAAAWPAF